MGKKVYAVKEGFDSKNNVKIENRIVDTWSECLSYVKGVKGAKYKGFESVDEAQRYLDDGAPFVKKSDGNYPEDGLHVYVDGSYNASTDEYSYGLVAVENGIVTYIESGKGKNDTGRNIRQIAGELKGALRAVEYAIEMGYERVVVFHDYEGVSHHATGFWSRKEESSQRYYREMQSLMSKGIEVLFVKVDSHTGDFFNELADEKCKEILGIPSNNAVEKWLRDNTVKAANEEVRNEIISVAPNNRDNVIIDGKGCNSNYETKVKAFDFEKFLTSYKENGREALLDISSAEKDEVILKLLDNMKI